jgi:hypothetical protein
MASERQRNDLREWLARTLPPELAEVVMESLPPYRWDELATKDDVRLLRSDLDQVRSDVAVLKTDVGVLKTDVAGLKTEMATFSIRLQESEQRMTLRAEAMEHRLAGEMRRLYVDQTRLLFFAMIGAIFTTATLAFAAVRF